MASKRISFLLLFSLIRLFFYVFSSAGVNFFVNPYEYSIRPREPLLFSVSLFSLND